MLVVLAGCPDTTSHVGGTSADDEVGEPPVEGDIVEDHRTFFIGESTKYDGGGDCENTELNIVTNTLHNRLVNSGWAGLRFVDDDTWPEDFREGSEPLFDLDLIYADAVRLAIYAGHGGIGRLQWGRPSPAGECLAAFEEEVRLGTLAGDTAAATMLMTSCTMRVDQAWPALRDNACRQFFGYHNSPHIGYDEARKVFKRTQNGQATVDAWLEEMVHNVMGNNSPVVMTTGVDGPDVLEMHGITNLATGTGFKQNVGEPIDHYLYEWFNNGCTYVCGRCKHGLTVPPEDVTPGGPTRRLKLTRRTRSSADLVELAVMLLARLDLDTLTAPEQARLDAWASAVETSGDVEYLQILSEPRVDLTYDPGLDELRITNRSALERARPELGETDEPDEPDLRAELRGEAEALRSELQAIPEALDRLGTEFEVSTREVGFGSRSGPHSPSIAYEVLFTLPGRAEDLALEGRSLSLGVTRLGERSTIVAASIDVEPVGDARFMRTGAQALDGLRATIQAEYPNATAIEFVEPRIGYALAEDQMSAEVTPSLLVSYVVAFGSDESRVVSRSVPVAISLVVPDPPPIEALLAQDPNPRAGDPRDSN